MTLEYDSSRLIIPKPLKITTDSDWVIYEMEGSLKNGSIIGTFKEKKYPKKQFQFPEGESPIKKSKIKIETMFCCTNHTPNDCVKTEKAAADSSRTKKCAKWQIRLL